MGTKTVPYYFEVRQMSIPDKAWRELAQWANDHPKPQPPELIPGLPAVNAARLMAYREQLVGWCVGKAEARLRGLE